MYILQAVAHEEWAEVCPVLDHWRHEAKQRAAKEAKHDCQAVAGHGEPEHGKRRQGFGFVMGQHLSGQQNRGEHKTTERKESNRWTRERIKDENQIPRVLKLKYTVVKPIGIETTEKAWTKITNIYLDDGLNAVVLVGFYLRAQHQVAVGISGLDFLFGLARRVLM